MNPQRISDGTLGMISVIVITVIAMLYSCREKEKRTDIDYLGQKPPGMIAELFAPSLITTNNYEHSAPAFAPDGSVVLWTVLDRNYHASMMQMKYENGKWSAPHTPSFADRTADDYYPSFSPDGKKLYFGSRRKAPAGYPGTDMRIWEVERTTDDWKIPVPMDTTVSKGKEFAHSVADNGAIYFSVAAIEGRNMNLQTAAIKNGRYAKPHELPYSINSVDYEDGPYIAPDESFLIFESQRPEGTDGSLDLYITFKTESDRWTVPLNMGPKINSNASERFARLSPDGKYLFFGSGRNQSAENFGFDIYWIDAKVIGELRLQEAAQREIDQPLGEEIIDALSKKDNERSAVLLKRWLDVNHHDLDATILYGATLRELKHYAEAEKLLGRVPSMWNENSSIVMEQALVKIGMSKDAEADALLAPILLNADKRRDRLEYLSNELLSMGMFQKSDDYFAKAMSVQSNMYDYFRRAQAYARVNEKEKAFNNLNKAVELGYNSKQELENEKSFASLRSDARWKELKAKMK